MVYSWFDVTNFFTYFLTKAYCDANPSAGIDPYPLLAWSWNRWWLDFVTFIAYKKVKTKFKKVQCILNRCKDLFQSVKKIFWCWVHLIMAVCYRQNNLKSLYMYIFKRLDSLKGNDWLKNSNVMAMIILRHTCSRKGFHIKAKTWLE